MQTYLQKYSLEERKRVASQIIAKYPNSIPIICEPSKTSKIELSKEFKHKYLIPKSATVAGLLINLRQHINMKPETALYLFVYPNEVMPPTSASILDLYNKYKMEDGFLYLTFSEENTFG